MKGTKNSHKAFLSKLRHLFHNSKDDHRNNQGFITSPIPHLLDANLPPMEEERRIIKETVLAAQECSSSLIEEVESASPAKLFINNHQPLLSVTRTIHDELLALIFLHRLPDLDSQNWGRQPWSSNPSFRLSHVCQRWRSIAINDSRLWSILGDIALSRRSANRKSNSSYVQFIKEIIRRSKDMDLWIYIHCIPSDWHPYKETMHPIVEILKEHESRWHVLGIDAPGYTVKQICEPTNLGPPIHQTLSLSFLRLRALIIRFWPHDTSGEFIGFSKAPSLTEVTINGVDSTFVLPFRQLRSYTHAQALDGSPIPDNVGLWLRELIKNGDNLESLGLFSGVPSSLRNLPTTPVLGIKILQIVVNSTQTTTEEFLNKINLPNLEDLKIASGYVDVMNSISSLIRLSALKNPTQSLRRLTLIQISSPPGALSDILKTTPYLEHLTVDFSLTAEILDLIGAQNGQVSRLHLPRLSRLVINTFPKNVDEDERIIVRLAEVLEQPTNVGLECQPLFRLIFPTHATSHYGQAALNGWLKTPKFSATIDTIDDSSQRKQEETLDVLRAWRGSLQEHIPELRFDRLMLRLHERPPPKRKYDLGFCRSLDILLNDIEKFELEEDRISALYISKLHISLQRLSELREKELYGDFKFKFRERASQTLTKWNAALLRNLQTTHIKWAIIGTRSLIYVGEYGSYWTSARVLSMIYGMEDNSTYENEIWSNHM